MKIPVSIAALEPRYQRAQPLDPRPRDARVEQVQDEQAAPRATFLQRSARIAALAELESAEAPANPAVGSYLLVQRSTLQDTYDVEIAGIDVYV